MLHPLLELQLEACALPGGLLKVYGGCVSGMSEARDCTFAAYRTSYFNMTIGRAYDKWQPVFMGLYLVDLGFTMRYKWSKTGWKLSRARGNGQAYFDTSMRLRGDRHCFRTCVQWCWSSEANASRVSLRRTQNDTHWPDDGKRGCSYALACILLHC